MRLQRQTNLHDAKSQQNQADGSDQTEDEIGQVVHCLDRIPSRMVLVLPFRLMILFLFSIDAILLLLL